MTDPDTTDPPRQLTRPELASMTHIEINTALEQGLLTNVLKGESE